MGREVCYNIRQQRPKGCPRACLGAFFCTMSSSSHRRITEDAVGKRKVRTWFYIDGFNVYHRIKEHHERGGKNYRWLDYHKLLCQFLKDEHCLAGITFFTAHYRKWGEGRAARHNAFLDALRQTDIGIVSGYFAKTEGGYEEKQTDVNIALAMVMDAVDDKYDRCWLLSADNDFAPVLSAIRHKFHKQAGLIIPPLMPFRRRLQVDALKNAVTTLGTGKPLLLRLKFARHFAGCSLPETIKGEREPIVMPPQYDTF